MLYMDYSDGIARINRWYGSDRWIFDRMRHAHEISALMNPMAVATVFCRASVHGAIIAVGWGPPTNDGSGC